MDIDRVRYFHIFVELGSLVKAAEVLHISQPALSKALKLLEREVGVKLLEPDGRGLQLTASGRSFQLETASLLSQWLQVPQKLALGNAPTVKKIGSFEVFTTYYLANLTKFVELNALELHEYGPGKLEQAIADGIVDIGITYVPIPKPQVEFVEVTKIRMGIFGLKKYKNMTLAELPFVVPLHPAHGTPSKILGLDGWPDHKYLRTVKYRVSMMESAIELCRQGLCVAYLPEFVVQLHNEKVIPELHLVEHASPVPAKDRLQSIFLVTKKNTVESKLYRQIAKSLRSLS